MRNLVSNLKHIAKRVFEPAEYKKFLDLAARFPNLNLYNLLLLYYQFPDAKLVAGQNAWKDNYGITVREDERAICLVRPTVVDEEETTLGYSQIGVFDISQLERSPEIKKEEYSIPDFFYNETGCTLSYDTDGILQDKEYEIIDEEFFVPEHTHLSAEENERNASKQMLLAYIEHYANLESSSAEDKMLIQSVKYILCQRYGLDENLPNSVYISNCKPQGLKFLSNLLEAVNAIIELIENNASVEFNFADLAFINLLIEANSKEEYEDILDLEVEDDDSVMYDIRAKFVDKLDLLTTADFNRIFTDRQNNKMLTQPPYKIKLIEEY